MNKIILVLLAVSMTLVSSAHADNLFLSNKQKCIIQCNEKYSSSYRECNDVKECVRFVEHEAKSCLKACEDK